ncbi:OmpH family outer membrane protein [Sphingomonas sp. GlSt437]|uniref:OmpH family outer membrane protein n=1 Tax=Sphingomonas sp. GlSt437 TaxID=3389970 RepID=UPI003A844EC7
MKMLAKSAALAAAMTAGALALPGVASAQSTLTVDINTLYSDSSAAKSGASQIQAKYGATAQTLKANLDAAYKALDDATAAARKVAKPDGTLAPTAPEADAYAKARQKAAEAEQQYSAFIQEVQRVDQYVRYQILEKVGPIAEQVRKTKNSNIVVPRDQTLAFDPATDITPAVLQQLNATMTTVSITPPQQQQAPAQGTPAPAPTQPAKQQPKSR